MTVAIAAVAVVMTASASAATYVYTGGLVKVGSQGSHVMDLQNCMNELGHSTGYADGIFGPMTKAGVMSFQASNGVAVDGIIGPVTGPLYTAACAEEIEEIEETEFDSSNGEEADVTIEDVSKEDDLNNDEKEQHAFTFEVEADEDGGAAQIERVDLEFTITQAGTGEDDLWDIIEAVTIEVDGDEVAMEESDDDDDWRDGETTLRLSGLDVVVESDESVDFDVLLDIADLDEADDLDAPNGIEIELTSVEIRYTDEAGITDTVDNTDAPSVDIEALDAIEFDVDESNDNPDQDKTVSLDEDVDGVVAFVNDVTVEEQDGVLETLTVEFEFYGGTDMTGADIDELVDDATLDFDGEEIDADDIKWSTIASGLFTVEFDMDDMDIEVDEEYEVTVTLDLEELEDGSAFIGEAITADSMQFEGEDQNDDDFDETEDVKDGVKLTLSAGALVLVDTDVDGYVSDIDAIATAEYVVELDVDGDDDVSLDFFTFDVDGTTFDVTADGDTVTVNGVDYTFELLDDDEDGDALDFGAEDDLEDADADVDDYGTYYIEVEAEAQAGEAEGLELELVSVQYDTFDGGVLVLSDQELTVELEADDITVQRD